MSIVMITIPTLSRTNTNFYLILLQLVTNNVCMFIIQIGTKRVYK